jgi:DNA gyrase/topoisomerase IV subunit A
MKVPDTVEYLLESSRDYSLYVNDTRAIPFVGDAFKHVQRVALWQMRNKAEKVKVVGLVGELAKEGLYVHGDVSCADAISMLAAPYKNNVPVLSGEGQFGSRVAPVEGIGAARYVSVKRTKAALAYLYVDTDIVPLEDNYDGSNQQPIHFLPLIPLVLLNGISGIGVGYSTNILPRSLTDIINATVAALKGKKFPMLIPHYERYDITVEPTGIPNQWSMSGKVTMVNTSSVLITELPPETTLEQFRKKLIDMEDEDKIVKFVDRSSDSIRIEVTFKRGSISGWTEKDAIAFFKLSEKTTERIVVRDWTNKAIIQYPDAETLITDFVAWRLEWYVVRYEKMLADANIELVYWRLLAAMFKAGFTKKLGTFVNRAAVIDDISAIATKAKIPATESAIDRAASLPTYRWTKDFEGDVLDKIKEIEASTQEYRTIIASPDRRKAIFLSEVEALKKIKL